MTLKVASAILKIAVFEVRVCVMPLHMSPIREVVFISLLPFFVLLLAQRRHGGRPNNLSIHLSTAPHDGGKQTIRHRYY